MAPWALFWGGATTCILFGIFSTFICCRQNRWRIRENPDLLSKEWSRKDIDAAKKEIMLKKGKYEVDESLAVELKLMKEAYEEIKSYFDEPDSYPDVEEIAFLCRQTALKWLIEGRLPVEKVKIILREDEGPSFRSYVQALKDARKVLTALSSNFESGIELYKYLTFSLANKTLDATDKNVASKLNAKKAQHQQFEDQLSVEQKGQIDALNNHLGALGGYLMRTTGTHMLAMILPDPTS